MACNEITGSCHISWNLQPVDSWTILLAGVGALLHEGKTWMFSGIKITISSCVQMMCVTGLKLADYQKQKKKKKREKTPPPLPNSYN